MDKSRFSQIEISGDAVMPIVKGIAAEALCQALLEHHGLENVEKGVFYPLNSLLALFKELERRMPVVLKRIGRLANREALIPPDLATLEQFLVVVDRVYYMNHRGCQEDEIGHFKAEQKSDREWSVISTTPNPCIFEQGALLGLADTYGKSITLEHVDGTCRSKGDPECNYRVLIDD